MLTADFGEGPPARPEPNNSNKVPFPQELFFPQRSYAERAKNVNAST